MRRIECGESSAEIERLGFGEAVLRLVSVRMNVGDHSDSVGRGPVEVSLVAATVDRPSPGRSELHPHPEDFFVTDPQTPEPTRVDAEALRATVEAIFSGLGLAEGDAAVVADLLLEADLMGISTHGVSNYIQMLYAPGLRKGTTRPASDMTVERELPTMALVDGRGCMGQLVGKFAMDLAIDKARATGVGLVAVNGSHHYGAAGVYSKMAIEHDMVGFAVTNADPLMVPLHGAESLFGTNPIAVAVPAGVEPPFLLDMATSTVPLGRVMLALRAGQPLVEGWAVDADGRPTTDARSAFDAKRLSPLGSSFDLGGHKGQGLAMVVDILSGLLSGAGVLRAVSVEEEVGHFFGAVRIDGFRDPEEFKAEMDAYLSAVRGCPSAPDTEPVLYAGVKEARARRDRLENGIPLHRDVIGYLRGLAEELGAKAMI